MIYLVLFHDDPTEILSAWNTKAEADAEITRILDTKKDDTHSWYYFQHRLEVEIMHIGVPKDAV